MATGLVKWWRARFLAGYKPFSVVGGIAEGSDSEELLTAGVPSPCNSSPITSSLLVVTPDTPTVVTVASSSSLESETATKAVAEENYTHNDTQQTIAPNETRQLSFEEFECDVSVAEGNRKRQEFSFTLYDFDGHGKITKDDIAGLVTTIYDTLGASIQVPPCGSKTIKVKLTVSPDKGTKTSSGTIPLTSDQTLPTASTPLPLTAAEIFATASPTVQAASSIVTGTTTTSLNTSTKLSNNLPNNIVGSSSCCHVKSVNSCGHANHAAGRRLPRRRRVRSRAEPRRAIESHSEDDADNVPPPLSQQSKQDEVRNRVGSVPHFQSQYSNSSEGDVSDESDLSPTITPLTPLVNKQRKRSGSMQRQQLLEIIQANMEKNNLSFHASRKRHQSDQHRTPYTEPSSPYNMQRNRSSSVTRQPATTNYHKPVREYHHSNHHHNSSTHNQKSSPKCRTKIGRKGRNQQQNTTPQKNTIIINGKSLHNNLQSSSPIDKQNLLNTEPNNQSNNNVNNNNNNNNNVNNQHNFDNYNKTSKKHQLKHATREQDQARAMAQVVKWLETEFKQKEAATSVTGGRRHVHEHIHHHYHHYAEAAIV